MIVCFGSFWFEYNINILTEGHLASTMEVFWFPYPEKKIQFLPICLSGTTIFLRKPCEDNPDCVAKCYVIKVK